MSVVVIKPGLLTTLQDRGRFGVAAFGVGHAGPMDDVAFRLANALVGNGNVAALEITVIGTHLRFDGDAVIALAGAPFDARIDGRPMTAWQPVLAPAGSTLEIGSTRHGARAYLAVAGGFQCDALLGSRATDVNAGLGPFDGRPLFANDVLHVATRSPARVLAQSPPWSLAPRPWFDADARHPIRVIRGTHADRLDADSQATLFGHAYRIGNDSNRVGFRLAGPPLRLAAPLESVSEPVAFGTVQLPPGGQPIVLMAEHPTTGGYPRIGQVAAVDLPRLAQRKPGDAVQFREIDLDEAQRRYLARERELDRFVKTIAERIATHE